MPDIRGSSSIAAGATVVNLLTGNIFEFVGPVPQAFELYAVFDTAAAGECTLDVSFGNAIVAQALEVPFLPVGEAGTGPFTNRHKVAEGVAMPGDRLVIKAQNSAGAAIAELRYFVKLRSVG